MDTRLAELIEVANHLRETFKDDNRLWSAKDCADYLGVKYRNFTERIALTKGFPRCIRLPTGASRGNKRWKAIEVKNYIDKLQKDQGRAYETKV